MAIDYSGVLFSVVGLATSYSFFLLGDLLGDLDFFLRLGLNSCTLSVRVDLAMLYMM